MGARNEKSMMKLVQLPIFRPILRKREFLWWFENSKNLKDLCGRPCHPVIQSELSYGLLRKQKRKTEMTCLV